MIAAQNILENVKVGISTSGSHELGWLGYGEAHLNDAAIEFARHLLYYGADLVYGHDLRDKKRGGYGWMFKEVAKSYSPRGDSVRRRVSNFLAYPFTPQIVRSAEREFHKYGFELVKAQLPDGLDFETLKSLETEMFDVEITELGRKDSIPVAKSTHAHFIWARSLTQMRKEMNSLTNARIFLGGKIHASLNSKDQLEVLSYIPGVLEECMLALNAKQPCYFIGAFGGMTGAICAAIQSKEADLPENIFDQNADLLGFYRSSRVQVPMPKEKVLKFFSEFNIHELGRLNGLSVEENVRLAETPHISEMVGLTLKGLGKALG